MSSVSCFSSVIPGNTHTTGIGQKLSSDLAGAELNLFKVREARLELMNSVSLHQGSLQDAKNGAAKPEGERHADWGMQLPS